MMTKSANGPYPEQCRAL